MGKFGQEQKSYRQKTNWNGKHPPVLIGLKHKNGVIQYAHIKVDRSETYFTNDPFSGEKNMPTNDICKIIEFLGDDMYVLFDGLLFRQTLALL